jgi:Flp pilus assembly protein protease CpaA
MTLPLVGMINRAGAGWWALAATGDGLSTWAVAELVTKLALTAWLVRVSYGDHMSGRIPNRLTAPVFFGVGLYRLAEGALHLNGHGWPQVVGLLFAWGLLFAMWMLHFIGGGDAKFLMALFALFPRVEFLAVLAFGLLAIMIVVLAFEAVKRREGAGSYLRRWRARLLTGQILPTEAELQTHGRRYAWTFAIPAAFFMWIYWQWPQAPTWWPL